MEREDEAHGCKGASFPRDKYTSDGLPFAALSLFFAFFRRACAGSPLLSRSQLSFTRLGTQLAQSWLALAEDVLKLPARLPPPPRSAPRFILDFASPAHRPPNRC